jgi:hypothetical protein
MATMTLDDLVRQLRAAYGAGLRAVVLYGSAAMAEQVPARADYNVLVIVDAIGLAELRAVAATVAAWSEARQSPPLTLTTREWLASADVFPMEYADVLAHHKVLHGALPTDGVHVNPLDLRRELEHQVLGKLLQLRAAILAAGNAAPRQLALLEQSLSTMMVLFRGVARLHGESPSPQREALARWTGEAAGFDAEPFVRVVRHVRGEARLAPADAEALLARYLPALEQLVGHLDAWRPPPTAAAA